MARALTTRNDLNVNLVGFIEAKSRDSGPVKRSLFGHPVVGGRGEISKSWLRTIV